MPQHSNKLNSTQTHPRVLQVIKDVLYTKWYKTGKLLRLLNTNSTAFSWSIAVAAVVWGELCGLYPTPFRFSPSNQSFNILYIVVWRYFKIHKVYNINFETSSPSPTPRVKETRKSYFVLQNTVKNYLKFWTVVLYICIYYTISQYCT